jgi:cytidylate kinase
MAAITISRQLGSLGSLIAKEIAERLNYRMVWREVINEAAVRATAPEVALSMIDDLDLFGLRPSYQKRKAYREAIQQIVHELADAGRIIIVGRAGQVILKEHPDVLHLRIIAPRDLRIERIATTYGIARDAACERVDHSDRTRRDYVRRSYHVDWNDPDLYDLVINTARLSQAQATQIICRAVASRLGQCAPTQQQQETQP